jgi:hypothetical protein
VTSACTCTTNARACSTARWSAPRAGQRLALRSMACVCAHGEEFLYFAKQTSALGAYFVLLKPLSTLNLTAVRRYRALDG